MHSSLMQAEAVAEGPPRKVKLTQSLETQPGMYVGGEEGDHTGLQKEHGAEAW